MARRLRLVGLRLQGAVLGTGVKFGREVTVDFAENLVIADHVSVQERCYLSAFGGITIGSEVSIGRGTCIVSSTHPYETDLPIRRNPLVKQSVTIGNNVWIGMNTSILAGVTLGDHTVVGAMSLVNRSLSADGVYAGVPAKLIKRIGNAH